jgi:hypothetical protein
MVSVTSTGDGVPTTRGTSSRGLGLRQLAGKDQADIASAPNIKQPSVSKIEKQTDMYLSTLRRYVEAVGGELELTVKLPQQPALRIQHLGDMPQAAANTPSRPKNDAASPRRRHG